ncbi:putative late blight resistance protein-like protein R1B-23-like [Hibiscus syriacus]|uniref:Late blight resistance protein-like protein R1B-23-like n=1 Tax=Hibiscus syriacus TaxID=106335 RepID=A0A6A3AAT5_HIBSY|nr:putative late blight resistance protein-like protein R1B-23-like [Hibiscus syriacus]
MNFVLTCDPANIHHVMISNFRNFPKGSDYKEIFDILGDGIFNADMDLWKYQRKLAQGFIRHPLLNRLLSTATRTKVENGLIPVLEHVAKFGLVVDLEDVFQRFTFDFTCILVTGNNPECLSIDFPEVRFSKALDEAEEALFYRHVRPRSFIKLQKWLNMGQENKYRIAWQVLDDVIAKYISQKRKQLELENQIEGVDLLASYITEEKSTGLKCDDKFLRDILNMIAGRDTTSSALTWFIWLVSKHPEVENNIIQSFNRKYQQKKPEKGDYSTPKRQYGVKMHWNSSPKDGLQREEGLTRAIIQVLIFQCRAKDLPRKEVAFVMMKTVASAMI